MPPTWIARCGACAEPMILRHETRTWYYVCASCGVETEPRETPAEADADVVWIEVPPVKRAAREG